MMPDLHKASKDHPKDINPEEVNCSVYRNIWEPAFDTTYSRKLILYMYIKLKLQKPKGKNITKILF
jgi:hypothetical protein